MAGELLPDRSRSERQRRIQRVAAHDENAARLSRRRRVWCAALCPGGMAALMRISGGMAAALLLLAPLAFGDSGVWGERGIVGRFAVRAPFLFEADGRGVSVFDVSTNTP